MEEVDVVRQSLKRRFPLSVVILLTTVFAVLAVVGQVGQNVTLTLWSSATQPCGSQNSSNGSSYKAVMDPYFVLSFASLSFVVIFGIATLVIAIVHPSSITKDDLRFPQWQFFLIGLFDALNGVLVVYASPSARTAPFLQAVLGNFLIPLTIVFRLIILRKKPTVLKLVCALMVFIALILSLIPVITGMDKDSEHGKQAWLQQSTASRILWPLCFMFGFVPAALMNIVEEKSLKDTRNVNLFYLLFCTSSYQLLTVGFLFWTDIIPKFGYVGGIHEFGENYWFALRCFFGQAGCDYGPGLRGTIFIVMYALSYVGGGLLLRYAEGATYLAIVQALVTPLGYLFWTLFDTGACGNFFWRPHADSLTYFSIGGVVLMFPAVLLYNIGTVDKLLKIPKKIAAYCSCCYMGKKHEQHIQDDETEPLLKL